MRYTVVCVGKLKEKFWVAACAEYVKRLGAYAKVEMREIADVDPARAGGVDAARRREGAAILAARSARARSSRAGSMTSRLRERATSSL